MLLVTVGVRSSRENLSLRPIEKFSLKGYFKINVRTGVLELSSHGSQKIIIL